MDDWWESEYGENGETCSENLTGYQPPEIANSEKLYLIECTHCQLRHRCSVGVMVLKYRMGEEMIARAYALQEQAEEDAQIRLAMNGLEAP